MPPVAPLSRTDALELAATRLYYATSGDYDRVWDDLVQRASRYMRQAGFGDDHPLQQALMHDAAGRPPTDDDLRVVERALREMAAAVVTVERRAA